MADEAFLVKLPMAVSVLLLILSLSTSQSFPFAEAEKLEMRHGSSGQCDIFLGEWVQDPLGPTYTNASCKWILDGQNCIRNGRPDTDYLHQMWKPFGCDLPRMDAATFLNAMKHKSLLYIGESVTGNQGQSLLCILSQVEEAILVYHDKKWQSKRYYFPTYNFTLGRIWSPFLVASTQKWSWVDMKISLDVLDPAWTEEYPKYDYVQFTGGPWFLQKYTILENHTVIGCHYCPERKDLKHIDIDYPYRKALQLTFDFMAKSDHKPLVIYRAWLPTHYEPGPFGEKQCNRTQPFKNDDEYTVDRADLLLRKVELEEMEKGVKNGVRLKHLDIYYLSLLRPDAHPGFYQNSWPDLSKPEQSDCLHWCLPGLPDTWNQLLMATILGEEDLKENSYVR